MNAVHKSSFAALLLGAAIMLAAGNVPGVFADAALQGLYDSLERGN